MHCSVFLHHPPENKKGYYLYGDPAIVEYILYDQFPLAHKVNSSEELASAAPGLVIVEPHWAFEALPYLELPSSERTYLFTSNGVENEYHKEVLQKFTKSKLPRVDCSDPTTPSTQQATVDYIQYRTKLVDALARKFAIVMNWDMSIILNSLCLWAPIAGNHTLPEAKALRLMEVLAPQVPVNEFIDNLLHGTFHRIHGHDYARLNAKQTLEELSDRLNKLRILMEVYTRKKNVSTLVKETGLTSAELKYYIPLLGKWSNARMKYWLDVLVWAHNRIENPGALPVMTTLLARK